MSEIDVLAEGRRVIRAEADAVAALEPRLDERFVRAVDMMLTSRGRVIVTGMGKSGLVGKKIAATLASTGTPAFSLHPAEASHGDLGMVTAEDVVLAISNSGETDEVVGLLPFIKRFGVKLISLTGNPESTLASAADVNLDVVCGEDACPMGIVPTSSTTATLALGDALAVALLGRRGFREEDFAAYHPKGALGRKLLTRVGDLMHTGPHVPAVSIEAPMSDVVVEISSKRFGFTTVLDSEGRMLGIVTDGDLRRGIEQHGQAFFGMSASEAMTRNPKTATAEMLAANALAVMQAHSITALVVADEGGRAEGVVHIHDILKAGIV